MQWKSSAFLLKAVKIHPQLWNKLALVKLGFCLLKQMHISGFMPQTHKDLIYPETRGRESMCKLASEDRE